VLFSRLARTGLQSLAEGMMFSPKSQLDTNDRQKIWFTSMGGEQNEMFL